MAETTQNINGGLQVSDFLPMFRAFQNVLYELTHSLDEARITPLRTTRYALASLARELRKFSTTKPAAAATSTSDLLVRLDKLRRQIDATHSTLKLDVDNELLDAIKEIDDLQIQLKDS